MKTIPVLRVIASFRMRPKRLIDNNNNARHRISLVACIFVRNNYIASRRCTIDTPRRTTKLLFASTDAFVLTFRCVHGDGYMAGGGGMDHPLLRPHEHSSGFLKRS